MTDDTTVPLDEPDHRSGLADHPLTAQRLAKLEALREAKGDPYALRFDRTHLAAELQRQHGGLEPGASTGVEVSVAGRVMLKRSFGKLVFLTLDDVSGRIQLFVSKGDLGDERFEFVEQLDAGDWVGAAGEVITTKKGELSVRVSTIDLLSKGLRPLPEKWAGLQDVEARSRRRYLDLIINPESRALALTRARIISEVRRLFEARDYIEFETPILQAEAGGALARPFATHHNALDIPMYLRIATELHLKRLVVGGLERVFEIGRIFRNEGIDSTHNPEFTTLESYEAFADYHDIMRLVEDVFSGVADHALGTTEITYQGRSLDLTPPFRRVRMVDLVAEAIGEDVSPDRTVDEMRAIARRHEVEPDEAWGYGKILEELFEAHCEAAIWEPTFVLDHPVEISPLARRHRDDPRSTERFELFIAGAEYANAFSELIDPIDQRRRFQDQAEAKAGGDDEAHPIDEDFLLAMEYGMPPMGGLGIGIDRLVMLLTDQIHIREVILFPTMRPER